MDMEIAWCVELGAALGLWDQGRVWARSALFVIVWGSHQPQPGLCTACVVSDPTCRDETYGWLSSGTERSIHTPTPSHSET